MDCLGDIVPVEKNALLDYTCPICHSLARMAQRARCCRKLFCKLCIEDWRKTRSHDNFTCPMCREELEDNYFEDGNATKRIRETKVYCPTSNTSNNNVEKRKVYLKEEPMMKCLWTGELKNVVRHLKVCDYKVVNCPNDECGIKTERRNLEMHFKTDCVFSCGHCKRRGLKFSNHYNQCPEFPVSCPNQGCTTSKIQKKSLKHHTSICLYRKVPCSAYCGQSISYIERQSHLKTSCVKRIVKCKYCNIKGEFEFINGAHYDSICTQVPIPCPNDGCAEKVKRNFITKHFAVCPKQRVSCKYVGICDEEMLRENEDLHNAGDKHLTCAYTEMLRLQKEHNQLMPLLEKHKLKIMHLKEQHESKIMQMKGEHEAEAMVLKRQLTSCPTRLPTVTEKRNFGKHESEIIHLKEKHKSEITLLKKQHESEKRWLLMRPRPEKLIFRYFPVCVHFIQPKVLSCRLIGILVLSHFIVGVLIHIIAVRS